MARQLALTLRQRLRLLGRRAHRCDLGEYWAARQENPIWPRSSGQSSPTTPRASSGGSVRRGPGGATLLRFRQREIDEHNLLVALRLRDAIASAPRPRRPRRTPRTPCLLGLLSVVLQREQHEIAGGTGAFIEKLDGGSVRRTVERTNMMLFE